ncbi:MAG: hypothetical protein DWQ37_11645 [Planctomycetota bacterium]|nr:MAG: hypothetical protein DWQ37_11645 [Planctomycetota bacterium]
MNLTALPDSAADRPLALRMRGDLELREQKFDGRIYWAVKDPISLRYFHLRDEEYTLLTMLDGQASLEELRERMNGVFAPRRISRQQIEGFLTTLHKNGLVLSEALGQGEQLLVRKRRQRRRKWLETLMGVLAIRFPGVNPRRVLDVLTPWFGWLFSPLAVAFVLVAAVAAVAMVVVEFDAVEARLPALDAIVSASNLPWMILSLAAIKILHELGHGIACRRLGGDCHEIGIMLLVFTPCLYCNVSDSWMLPSKWRRIAIAAAGIYVELILATLCTFLWWFSQPGLLNVLCLNTVILCSLGTVLLNGNPLLRYDGYFILSDLVEVPNLKAQSSAALRRLLARCFLGVELPRDRLAPEGKWAFLLVYGVASIVYRLVVIGLVLWVLNELLEPYHLQPLVVLVACITAVGLLWPAGEGLVRWLRNPMRQRVAPLRVMFTGGLLAAALAAIVMLPLPMHVSAPAMIEYRDARRVYVTVPGTLAWSVPAGREVQAGEIVAQLEDTDIEREVIDLTSQRDRQQLHVTHLAARRLQGGTDGAEAPAAESALGDLEEQLTQVTRDAERLTLVAPAGGTVLPPPHVSGKPAERGQLPRWSGTPLDPNNQRAFLDTGTLVCLVGQPNQFEAILHIDENDVELVHTGQRVHVMPDHTAGESFAGTLVEIARLDLESMPSELAAAGDLPAATDARGVARPLNTWYQARVRFDADPPRMIARMHARAKIEVNRRTLGSRLVRYLTQTFGG